MSDEGEVPKIDAEAEAAIQWDMFTRHQALGEWWGEWQTYDYMGDVVAKTVAGVNLIPNADMTSVSHSHSIVTDSKKSDCETCFDSENLKTLPITTYAPGKMGRNRCAAVGMVAGPSLLPRSGIMSTELSLRHGNGRVRVTFQHAPVWERGVEPGSCPPQGLKIFRALVSKERLRNSVYEEEEGVDTMARGPPTPQEEERHPPKPGNPQFFRGVPPFKWHAKWAGTSWTWGPTTGDRGWSVEELDEADSWHGRARGDVGNVWSLRLGGGVLIQCPSVIVGGESGLCRLAWLPEEEGEPGTASDGNQPKLLRIEANVMALEPVVSEDDDELMVAFHPPSLGSLRCDALSKTGELENASLEERASAAEGFVTIENEEDEQQVSPPEQEEGETASSSTSAPPDVKAETKGSQPLDTQSVENIAADPRNALDF